MKRKYVLFSIVVVIALLVAASGVGADDQCTPLPPLPSLGVPVQRTCTINLSADGTKYVTILAGPNGTGGLSAQFPVTCTNGQGNCLCDSASSTCLEWIYQWTISGLPKASLNQALIAAGSNVTVFSSDPSGATVLQPIIAQGERFIQFSVSGGTTFTGAYFTPLNITPGTLTAAFVGKNGVIPLLGRCALAGADFVTVSQNQAVPAPQTQIYTTVGGCTVSLQVDPSSNKVIPGTIKLIGGSPSDCSLSETTSMTVDGKMLVNITAGQWTEQGSCSYCFVNTNGGKTCNTCTSCKIVNGVCTK